MVILGDTSPEVQKAFQTILDVFAATDGGGSLARMSQMIVELDIQSKNGDVKAKQILEIVKQFGRLCELSQKPS